MFTLRRPPAGGSRATRSDGPVASSRAACSGRRRVRTRSACVLREARRPRRAGARAVPESARRRCEPASASRCRRVASVTIVGPARRHRAGRHAEPAADFRLPAGDVTRRRRPCAKTILAALARRAYRGTDSRRGRRRVARFFSDRARDGQLRRRHRVRDAAPARRARSSCSASKPIAASARHGFRRDNGRAGGAGTVYRISDLELASRLSFFLWSSIPDDELLDAGGAGQAAGIRRCSSARCGGCWPIRAPQR